MSNLFGRNRFAFENAMDLEVLKEIPSVKDIIANAFNGQTVDMVFYGDSQVDGLTTTTHTNNVLGIDHAATAPNAFPQILEGILQDYTGNANVSVHNAGFVGKQIVDGWAVANFEAAISNNTFYQNSLICFIEFGTNDVESATALDTTEMLNQYNKLIKKVIAAGMRPVIMGSSPIWGMLYQDSGAGYDAQEIFLQCENLKKDVATLWGIDYVSIWEETVEYTTNNISGLSWVDVQADKLHFGDTGHLWLADLFAKELFISDIIICDGTKTHRINQEDYRSNFYYDSNRRIGLAGYDTLFEVYGNAPSTGSNKYTANDVVLTHWVWVDKPTTLVYRDFANSGSVNTATDRPTINVFSGGDMSTPAKTVDVPNSDRYLLDAYSFMERPHVIQTLDLGLHKITFKAQDNETMTSLRWGYFEFNYWDTKHNYSYRSGATPIANLYKQKDALKNIGSPLHFNHTYSGSGTDYPMSAFREEADGSNVVHITENGDMVDILVDMDIDENSGFMFLTGPTASSASGNNGCMSLFRTTGTGIELNYYKDGIANRISASGTLAANQDAQKFTIRVEYEATNYFRIQVWDSWNPTGAAIIDYKSGSTYIVATTGAVGGIEFVATGAGTQTCEINTVLIREYL